MTSDIFNSDESLIEEPTTAPSAHEPPDVASHVAGGLETTSLQASLSMVGSARAEQFEAVGSAVGFTSAGGDATITASFAPIVHAKGDIHVRQAYTSAIVAGGTVEISQAGAPLIIGKKLSVHQGGGIVMLTGKAKVKQGFVGVLLTPNATISEDSRVLLSTKAALIIACALFGGFAMVAIVMALGVRRVASWRSRMHVPAVHMPAVHMPAMPAMPDFSAITDRFHHRHAG